MDERERFPPAAALRSGAVLRPMALLAAAALLGGCSLLGPDTPEGTTPAPTPAESARTGGHVEGDDREYSPACTMEGAHTVDSSTERTIDDLPGADGEELTVALGFTSPDGPRVRLYVSTVGGAAAPVQWEGEVGDALEHEDWQLTITSICANEVRFDVTAGESSAAG